MIFLLTLPHADIVEEFLSIILILTGCKNCSIKVSATEFQEHVNVCLNSVTKCPVCHIDVLRTHLISGHHLRCPEGNKPHVVLLMYLECKNGCGTIIVKNFQRKHDEVCPKKPISCAGCGKRVPRCCTLNPANPHCVGTILFFDVVMQLLVCPFGCQEMVEPLAMGTHKDTCPAVIQTCPAVDLGCTWSGTRTDFAEHVSKCSTIQIQDFLQVFSKELSDSQALAKILMAKQSAIFKRLEEMELHNKSC